MSFICSTRSSGIHAILFGHLAGPYTFVTKGDKEPEESASAIIKIEMKLMDTLTGRTLKNIEASNPILATKMKGSFSEEKAKIKAIDVTLSNLIGPLSRELDSLDWFCRIAKVEGEEVYLNAGKLTGIREGDVMEVSSARETRGTGRDQRKDPDLDLLWDRCVHGQPDSGEKTRGG